MLREYSCNVIGMIAGWCSDDCCVLQEWLFHLQVLLQRVTGEIAVCYRGDCCVLLGRLLCVTRVIVVSAGEVGV